MLGQHIAAAPRILVTGGSGFIGRRVCCMLAEAGYEVVALVFRNALPAGIPSIRMDLLAADLRSVCAGFDVVVHLAAFAHVPAGRVDDHHVRRLNVTATAELAESAACHGAYFIFVSSAKVLGDSGEWDDMSPAAPQGIYAQAKFAAEEAIQKILNLKFTILRPPLVYGPGVGGDFLRLLRWADLPLPVPLASFHNLRSLLYVDNLGAAILACVQSSEVARGQTWLLSDGMPLSVASLVFQLSEALGHSPHLCPFPPRLLSRLARLVGRSAEIQKLAADFVLHDRLLRERLDWRPAWDTSAGLRATAAWFDALKRR